MKLEAMIYLVTSHFPNWDVANSISEDTQHFHTFPIHRHIWRGSVFGGKSPRGFGQVELQLELWANPVSHGLLAMKNKKMTIFVKLLKLLWFTIFSMEFQDCQKLPCAKTGALKQVSWSSRIPPHEESLSRGMGVMWHPKWRRGGGGSQCSRQFCTNLAVRDCDYFNLVMSRQLDFQSYLGLFQIGYPKIPWILTESTGVLSSRAAPKKISHRLGMVTMIFWRFQKCSQDSL